MNGGPGFCQIPGFLLLVNPNLLGSDCVKQSR